MAKSKAMNRRTRKGIESLLCQGVGCPLTDGCGRVDPAANEVCHGERDANNMWACEAFAYASDIPADAPNLFKKEAVTA